MAKLNFQPPRPEDRQSKVRPRPADLSKFANNPVTVQVVTWLHDAIYNDERRLAAVDETRIEFRRGRIDGLRSVCNMLDGLNDEIQTQTQTANDGNDSNNDDDGNTANERKG